MQHPSLLLRLPGIFLLIALGAIAAKAQSTDEPLVKRTIEELFNAMRKGDSAGVAQAFAPKARLESIWVSGKNNDSVSIVPISAFASSVARRKAGSLDEQIVFGSVRIDDGIAQVWTPYRFFLNQAFNHCGVNAFTLVKLNGQWLITHLIDTRRKSDCP
jgi:hypothetical protein